MKAPLFFCPAGIFSGFVAYNDCVIRISIKITEGQAMKEYSTYHRFKKRNGEEFYLPASEFSSLKGAIEHAEKIDAFAVYLGIKIHF